MIDDDPARRMERIEQLVGALEDCGHAPALATARELVDHVLALHRSAIARLISVLSQRSDSFRETLATAATDDPLIGHLLMLHNLHPIDLRRRVDMGLEQVRASLPMPDATIEIEDASPRIIRLRFDAPSDPGTCISMQRMLENAMWMAAPEVAVVECRAAIGTGKSGFIPLPILTR